MLGSVQQNRITRKRGYSLVELMLVVMFAAIIVATGVPSVNRIYNFYRLRTSAEALAAEIQAAKMRALQRNQSLTLTINAANRTYQLQGQALRFLENSVSFSGIPPSQLVFNSRGRLSSANTATIQLAGRSNSSATITVNPSGRVTLN